MPAAIRQMVDYAFSAFEITRVFARPFGSNQASQRVLEKAGFTLEARLKGTIDKNGRTEDELIYAVRR
jgi:RimJ/RimL family protein N-acetyltransferase